VNEFRFHFGRDGHFDLSSSPAIETLTTIQNPDIGFVFGGNRSQLSTVNDRNEFADNSTRILGRRSLRLGVDNNINPETDHFVYGPKGECRLPLLRMSPAETSISICNRSDRLQPSSPRLPIHYLPRTSMSFPAVSISITSFAMTCKFRLNYQFAIHSSY